MTVHKTTSADTLVKECIDNARSFAVVAGAGSGKTSSLIEALHYIRDTHGSILRRDAQRVACITYTNRAVEVIRLRLSFDPLFSVSTLHTFLWSAIKRFTPDIRQVIREKIIPDLIAKKKEDDNGGSSKKAIAARDRIAQLSGQLSAIDTVTIFRYDDSAYSDFAEGQIGHDDVIEIAAALILKNEPLQSALAQSFPFIFVDEAQDTFPVVMQALNAVGGHDTPALIGYFGDPMQQIYDDRVGDLVGPNGYLKIEKPENFRCSKQVIEFLNRFRSDLQQFPAGKNAEIEGSVEMMLIATEKPTGPRNRYSESQLKVVDQRYESALQHWGWSARSNIKQLFLVRQMIARRLGFSALHRLFTGPLASTKAQDEYQNGSHFLLKPFVETLCPLINAARVGDARACIDIMRRTSPFFDPLGVNAHVPIGEMIKSSEAVIGELSEIWNRGTTKKILHFSQKHKLCAISERLSQVLSRPARSEEYDADVHVEEKGDWLADEFFSRSAAELTSYASFIADFTPFSTQHGVKGEEYGDVVVLFDDVDAAWTKYNFSKLLTPVLSGDPTEDQLKRSQRLAYVCFSRAITNLRIVLFTPNVEAAKKELLESGVLLDGQINNLIDSACPN